MGLCSNTAGVCRVAAWFFKKKKKKSRKPYRASVIFWFSILLLLPSKHIWHAWSHPGSRWNTDFSAQKQMLLSVWSQEFKPKPTSANNSWRWVWIKSSLLQFEAYSKDVVPNVTQQVWPTVTHFKVQSTVKKAIKAHFQICSWMQLCEFFFFFCPSFILDHYLRDRALGVGFGLIFLNQNPVKSKSECVLNEESKINV